MTYDDLLFDGSDLFDVVAVKRSGSSVEVLVESRQKVNKCPGCNEESKWVHSYYDRKVLDLPMLSCETWIKLKARKFYCRNDGCGRKIFTERFSNHFTKSSKMTGRVKDKVLKVALYLGGNGGEKICRLMNMPVSSSTLIRTIHNQPEKEEPPLRVVGIDDWAFKKRLKYGTVVVDMERRRIVDLLPDRETGTVKQWLINRPEIEVVTRDRYSNYANGVKQASAQIVQVADRWHLIKNMGDALDKLLVRNSHQLRLVREHEQREQQDDMALRHEQVKNNKFIEKSKLLKKFIEVKELLSQRVSISKISRDTKVDRRTIRKWRSLDELPKKRVPSGTKINLYESCIRELLNRNSSIETKEIWRIIKGMGYTGKQTTAYEDIGRIRGKKQREYIPKLSSKYWLSSKASRLLYNPDEKLSEKEQKIVRELCQHSKEISMAKELVAGFRSMMENKKGSTLKDWIVQAQESGVKELKGFATSLLTDYDAVQNAINLPWSNGQVEGQVNKLKTIKRQMYGRASFKLLRKRLIYYN